MTNPHDITSLIREGRELLAEFSTTPKYLLWHSLLERKIEDFAHNNLARFLDEIERLQADGLSKLKDHKIVRVIRGEHKIKEENAALRAELAIASGEVTQLTEQNEKLWTVATAARAISLQIEECDDVTGNGDEGFIAVIAGSDVLNAAIAALPERDPKERP